MSETIHPAVSNDEMTPEERFQEVVAVFARGFLRLNAGTNRSSAESRQKPLTSDRDCALGGCISAIRVDHPAPQANTGQGFLELRLQQNGR